MKQKKYPKIYLAIDTVVFYKRWTRPMEWARRVRELGLTYVEASADTELDPLYMGPDYFRDWLGETRQAQEETGVRVANLFSGHGTYTTLGLAHPDERVRSHIIHNWFEPMLDMAGDLGCGMGFFAHAFEHQALQDAEVYQAYVETLEENLAHLSCYAKDAGCRSLAIEQMYTPHQYPWRRKDMEKLLGEVTRRSGADFYFTEDVGHHLTRFTRPDREAYADSLRKGDIFSLWLGTDRAYELAAAGGEEAWEDVSREMDAHPYLFSESEDGDCYAWLRELGAYSPIVHLQQTDGKRSVHLPFTPEWNETGKIHPRRVLEALREAYDRPRDPDMPAPCEDVWLTLEVFSGTTSIMPQIMAQCAESVRWWRQWIPEDGMALDELLALPDPG